MSNESEKREKLRLQLSKPVSTWPQGNEMFTYGALEVYLSYIGLNHGARSWAHIPHSIWTGCSEELFHETEMASRGFSTLLVHNRWDKEIYSKLLKNRKKVEVVCHPFYILEKVYGRINKEEKRGTVFFYPHGLGSQCPPALSLDVLVKYLTDLDEKHKPLYVCFHYNDYLSLDLTPLRDAGLNPVCAGNPRDPEFMLRLYVLLDESKTTISVDYGTQVFLSIISGCRTYLEDKLPVLNFTPPEYYPCYGYILPFEHYGKFFKLLKIGEFSDNLELSAYADELLGRSEIPTSSELLKIFSEARLVAFKFIKDASLTVPIAIHRFFTEPMRLKMKGLRLKLGLRLLRRRDFYVYPPFGISRVITHQDTNSGKQKQA